MKPVACLVLAALVAAPLAAQDQGITSETHRKHLGKIVWSKQRIRMDAQDQTPKVSSFQWGDPIYGRAYFPKSIVALGQALGLRIVAEGVETDMQQDFLTRLGCDALQGFLLGHPLPADSFMANIRRTEEPVAPDKSIK